MKKIRKRSAPPEASKYNTYLPPDKEVAFQDWAGPRINDTENYDLRGYYSSVNGVAPPLGEAHLTDQFKKPNHPTFSSESQYHGVDGNFGGVWTPTPVQDVVTFEPGLSNRDPLLDKYFEKVEPTNYLIKKRKP